MAPLEPLHLDGVYVDVSKQLIDVGEWHDLQKLADETELPRAIAQQFDGSFPNQSEATTVQHARLRTPFSTDDGLDEIIADERERMLTFAEAVRTGKRRGFTGLKITTVVNIGIGGSHLGTELLFNAFDRRDVDVRFLANIDPDALQPTLDGLDPERTLVIVASKSFGTLEARQNAEALKSWFTERGAASAIATQFVAVTERTDRAMAWGIAADACFRLFDWTGGRYSIWSSIGLATAIAFGRTFFEEFLGGARALDLHFRTAPMGRNLPVRLALIALWNSHFLHRGTHLILPYDRRLRDLPTYLQQLELESNGKRVHADGRPVSIDTAPFVWGGEETNGQHTFHQFLLQGTRRFSADFVAVSTPATDHATHHRWLLANCFAQSRAMRFGNAPTTASHTRVIGGSPSTTMLLDDLTPHSLGLLIALYEQKVFCLGHLWQINSFDQWGVELGKSLAEPIFEALAGTQENDDPSTQSLITQAIKSRRSR